MNTIDKIIKHGLCLGCGLCETISTREKCEMKLNDDGFYEPQFKNKISTEQTNLILKSCPGIHVESQHNSGVWGSIKQISEAWSADSLIRKKASSGGVISTLAIYLLDSQKVDCILQVGVRDDSYLYNTLRVSRTREDILRNAASRYSPALIFNKIIEILDSSNEKYAFIGKPCDIAGIKNFIIEFPQYKNRIIYFLAIFCAGMPSYNGTKELLNISGSTESPLFLKYRGDGWPGFFEAKYKDKPTFKMSYDDSWGKVLNRYLNFRCKICPDGIGLLADIAVGDSWNTKNGYPDFEERDGRSFVMLRTDNGLNLFEDAIHNQKIISQNLDISKISEMQNYQYKRRLMSGYRILPVYFFTGMILNFKGLGILKLMLQTNKVKGLKESYGTLKRLLN